MPEAPVLRAEQQAFLDDLLGRSPRSRDERRAMLRQPPSDDVEGRFQIYASGLPARVAEALENDFPALARILGPGALRSLSARYVAAHPPRSYDIGRVGDRLAGFLESDPLARRLPFLPDLARYEWAIAEAFVASDATPAAWADLAGMAAGEVARLRFGPLPGTTLVRSQWPLRALRATRDVPDEQVSLDMNGQPCLVLVHRRGLEVVTRDPAERTARLLETLARGVPLGEAAEEGAEDATVAAFRRLVDWGALTSPEREGRWRNEVRKPQTPYGAKTRRKRW